jgi:site-specific DNA-methyltransferase (adenine-specific)
MRQYKGYSFEFEKIAAELCRVIKIGGVIVWIVGDATINGSETGTSFRQALYFKELGLNLETMIWEKTGSGCLGNKKYYNQNFEYMFIICRGNPKTINLICDRENKIKSGKATVNRWLDKTGKGKNRVVDRKPFGKRNNIWRFDTQKGSPHPAPFPLQLAEDHIISWSNEGDTVLDPFLGSGTTGVAAVELNRKFIGIEISPEYLEMAKQRMAGDTTNIKKETQDQLLHINCYEEIEIDW